jgi:hypothetical protein
MEEINNLETQHFIKFSLPNLVSGLAIQNNPGYPENKKMMTQ